MPYQNPETSQIRKDAASLKAKLMKARDDGPSGPDVVLSPTEAMIAWRAIFGDLSNGHR